MKQYSHIHIIGILKREKRENGAKNLFKDLMAEKITKAGRQMKSKYMKFMEIQLASVLRRLH